MQNRIGKPPVPSLLCWKIGAAAEEEGATQVLSPAIHEQIFETTLYEERGRRAMGPLVECDES